MLTTLVVALSLEGVFPRLRRLRRPVPIVRYDRIRELRAQGDLRVLAGRLLHAPSSPVPIPFTDGRRHDTRSGGASTGARTVLFLGS